MSRVRSLIIALLIAVLALGLTERTIAPVRAAVGAIIYPISRPFAELTLGFESIGTTVHNITSLRDEVRVLTSTNQQLNAELAELDTLRHENDALRQALNFSQAHQDQSLIAGQVIGRSPTSFLESLTVNKGSDDGVTIHAPVIANGYLVGVVSACTAHTATVTLITASNSVVPVVFADSRAQGLLQGGLSGLAVQDVAIDATVHAGEPLVTSALGGTIPANIAVGMAGASRTTAGSIVQTIPITSPIDIAHLELVFVEGSTRSSS